MPRVFYSRREPFYRFFPAAGGIVLALFFLFGAGWLFSASAWTGSFNRILRTPADSRALLVCGIPVLVRASSAGEAPAGIDARVLLGEAAKYFLGRPSPRFILQAQLSLPDSPPGAESPSGRAVSQSAVGERNPAVQLSGDCLVGIYHTHTGETYALSDGTAREDGRRGGVVLVGEAIKQVLESKYGIRTDHDETINDANYNTSYMVSEQTARKMLAANPHLLVLLDIHRDAGLPRRDCLVKVNGREMAPILFIVGSDARAPFPNWRQNYRFASQLAAAVNKKYPGLVRGVRVKEGRYNQFLHPRALLVEVGSANNYTSEAVAAGRLFADVLGEVVTEIEQKQQGGEGTGGGPGPGGGTGPDESGTQSRK